jgi:hypothetical protein
MTMGDLTFVFRNAGPSGHGAGRIRYFVDVDNRCIGSVEGKTGSFRLDADYVSEDMPKEAKARIYRTRVEAAHALADISIKVEAPPVSAAEYRILQRCKRGDSFEMPTLGFARILASRGLLTQKRGTNQFRTTARGAEMVARYEAWVSQRLAQQQGEHR